MYKKKGAQLNIARREGKNGLDFVVMLIDKKY